MTGLAEEAECFGCPEDVPGGDRCMGEGASLEEGEQLGEGLADPVGSSFDQVEGAVLNAGMFFRHLLGVADICLAQLDEASACWQQLQRGVDELAGEGV